MDCRIFSEITDGFASRFQQKKFSLQLQRFKLQVWVSSVYGILVLFAEMIGFRRLKLRADCPLALCPSSVAKTTRRRSSHYLSLSTAFLS
jgi:hypothetical protein